MKKILAAILVILVVILIYILWPKKAEAFYETAMPVEKYQYEDENGAYIPQ